MFKPNLSLQKGKKKLALVPYLFRVVYIPLVPSPIWGELYVLFLFYIRIHIYIYNIFESCFDFMYPKIISVMLR